MPYPINMKRLLFISHRLPYPPDKGERVRAFNELKALCRDYSVVLASLAHSKRDFDAAGKLRRYCCRVMLAPAGGAMGLARGLWSLLRGRSVTEGYFWSARLARQMASLTAEEPFDLVVVYCSGMVPLAAAARGGARIMDLVDVDSEKWRAYAARSRWPMRWLYSREAAAVGRLEQRALRESDAVTLVSEAEARMIGDAEARVRVVGNGVDFEYFDPRLVAINSGAVGPSIVFTGSMDYRPNSDGVCWFAQRVWPDILKAQPDLRLVIVGRNPTAAVRRLADRPAITVTGAVEDVRPYLAAATAAIAPLLVARGVQNKVLEAMSMGKAVVGSLAAMEGLQLELGRDALVADAPSQWVETILRLIGDHQFREQIQQAARLCVERTYSWESQMMPLVSLCHTLTGSAQSVSRASAA
jgi:sugar transferase (PEP-CTERM/EpsH1 system associated)